ncbi:AAA family ATPase [Flavobacteriaceae bacterium]|nr:AAA family ATPase [Flavobacteriaceae bacterium]
MSKESFKNSIELELNKSTNELSKKLESYRIDILEVIPPPEIAWEIRDDQVEEFIPLGTHGNFSMVKGKAKSKKSFFINMAIATAVGKGLLQNKLRSPLKDDFNQVVYFDTEQSKYHVQKAVKRICTQIGIGIPSNLNTYGLRKASPSERLKLVEYAIENTPSLGFVVIDGIRDLITSINDEAEASNIASKLLKWTEEYNIHIVVVLHENPGSDKARGHIGTELMNKAETVIALQVDKYDDNVSIVSAGLCRNKAFKPFAFTITDEGLPQIIEDYVIEVRSKKKGFDVLALSPSDKFTLLQKVFKNGEGFQHSELVTQIKIVLDNKYKGNKGKGITKIKELITASKNDGWLIQDGNRQPYRLGKLSV